jgi:hypothetical protein
MLRFWRCWTALDGARSAETNQLRRARTRPGYLAARITSERAIEMDRKLPPGPGRPRGSRNLLQRRFIEALAKDFEENGEPVIRIVRMEEPATYLKLIASVLPKEFLIETREIEHMSDEEIKSALDALGKFNASSDGEVIH